MRNEGRSCSIHGLPMCRCERLVFVATTHCWLLIRPSPSMTVSGHLVSSQRVSAVCSRRLMKQDSCDLFRGSDRCERGETDSRPPGRTLGRTVVRAVCSTRWSDGRHLSRPIEGGELSTQCSAAQRDAAQCERRFSAARALRVIRRAGRSDPPLRCLRQPRGWPRGGGRSCPRHARTPADRAPQLRANLFTISSVFRSEFAGGIATDSSL